jgi:formylglycine-generating enzyme required for sulfatase activity
MKRVILLAVGACLAACSDETASVSAPVQQSHAAEAPACGLAPDKFGQFVTMPEGGFEMGANGIYPEEGPQRTVHVASFEIQIHEVINRQFEQFVAETGYVTDAERTSASGDPGGGSGLFTKSGDRVDPGHWILMRGATWKTPAGPGSSLAGKMDQPVVHVSLRDAEAYATWAGGRLPTEEEWEYAAMRGMADPADAVSGAYDSAGRPVANTWQGIFPVINEGVDGFVEAAPAGCFPASGVGLYDMIGNVWEWTATSYSPRQNTIKGGSFLCAENFCKRYRGAARQGQDIDFSSNHIGFRIVRDVAQ